MSFLLALHLDCSSFSRFLRWKVRLFIWGPSSFFNMGVTATHFPPSTAFPQSHIFCYDVFLFLLISKHFLIFLMISFLAYWLFSSVLFNYHVFVNFPNFLLLLIFNLIPLWSENILCLISVLSNLLCLVLCLAYGLSWRMFHVHLRRMSIMLLLGGGFYRQLLGLIGLQCCWSLLFLCWSSA